MCRKLTHYLWPWGGLALVAVLGLAVAACGGTTSSNTSASPTSTATSAAATYGGPEKQYIGSLAEPQIKAGYKFKVGFLQGAGMVPLLVAEQKAFEAKIAELGGEVVVMDAALDVQKQVSQFNNMLSMKVDAIAGIPVVMASLTQSIKTAKAAGIPVVVSNSPPDVTLPVPDGVAMVTTQGIDTGANQTVAYVAQQIPNGKVAIMGLGLPVDPVVYMAKRMDYWAKQMGLQVVDRVDAKEDSPGAYSAAASAIIGRNPDVQAILTYQDTSSLATIATLKAAGKEGVPVANPNGGLAIAAPAIKNGSLLCDYRAPWPEMGQQLAIATYDELTDQNLPLPKFLIPPSVLVTKENVDQVQLIQ